MYSIEKYIFCKCKYLIFILLLLNVQINRSSLSMIICLGDVVGVCVLIYSYLPVLDILSLPVWWL